MSRQPAKDGIKAVPIDPQLVPILAMVQDAIPVVGLSAETIPQLREAFAARPTDEELSLGGAFSVKNVDAQSEATGHTVDLVVCTPNEDNQDASFPVVFYAHGGGLVAGHNRSNLLDVLQMAAEAGAGVVSVEYRLAPEHPYPAALDDCRVGLEWTRVTGPKWGLDPTRVIVCGTSAGAGLVAALSLFERDQGEVRTLGQMLLSPMLSDAETTSARQMAGAGVWDQVSNLTGWAAYGAGDLEAVRGPYAMAGRASDLSNLPATFLDVGSAETFRDDVVNFASRMWAAGCDTELHVWPGGFHNFDSMVPGAAISRDAKAARADWLRRLVDTSA